MIKLENYEVMGWEHAIRGMRNPMNSWEKSDSEWGYYKKESDMISVCNSGDFVFNIGPNDQNLMMKLAKGGSVHAKYRRMITVYVDITAPLYWWKEFDTYKVGTVANSCSTMHKIHEKEFTLEDFSHEHLLWSDWFEDEPEDSIACVPAHWLNITVGTLNYYRKKYLEAKTKPLKEESKRAELMKKYWWQMIQLLPSSYNQKRTVMLDYEVLANIYRWRNDHKLDEWRELCEWIEKLPYSEIITGEDKDVIE